MQRSKRTWCSVAITVTILGVAACTDRQSGTEHQSNADEALAANEFGRSVDEGQPAKNIETFDKLASDVISDQKGTRRGKTVLTRRRRLPASAG